MFEAKKPSRYFANGYLPDWILILSIICLLKVGIQLFLRFVISHPDAPTSASITPETRGIYIINIANIPGGAIDGISSATTQITNAMWKIIKQMPTQNNMTQNFLMCL
jgi:hypothetical protein